MDFAVVLMMSPYRVFRERQKTSNYQLRIAWLMDSLNQIGKCLLLISALFSPEPPCLVYAAAVVSRFKEGKPSVEGETDALSVKLWALSDNLGKFPTFGHNWVITSTVGCPIDGLKRQWSWDRVPQSFRGKLSFLDHRG